MENVQINEGENLELSVSEIIPSTIDRTFVAWLEPYDLKCFMSPSDGVQVSVVDNRPAEGGHFLIELSAEGQVLPHRGEYRLIERPNKLVFTWESAFSAPGSLVSIEFHKIDPSNTEVKLSHRAFTDQDSMLRHKEGWKRILRNLKDYLS